MPRYRNWQRIFKINIDNARVAELADLPAGRQARTTQNIIKMIYHVYAIKSEHKNYIYVGLTNNPTRRIAQHNNKKEKVTRCYAPFKIIILEQYETRPKARLREKYLKSGIGKEYLKSI